MFTSALARLTSLRGAASQLPISSRFGVSSAAAASSSAASARFSSTFMRREQPQGMTGFPALPTARDYTFQPSPYSGLCSRGFSSFQQRTQGTGSNKFLLAIGTAFVGIGSAGLVYFFTDEGKRIGDDTFLVNCAEQEGQGGGAGGDGCGCPEAKPDCIERKCGDSDCLRKMDREEELIQKANAELEKALKDVKPKAVEYTESALKAYCEATELIRQFMDKVYCAIEEDNLESPRFEEVWCDIYDTALKRCEKVKEALVKGQCAWELLCRLREVIENGKACKYTSCNPLLVTAEEALLCAERELLNAKAKMECMQSESILVEQYKILIEEFRRDIKAELDSMIPAGCMETLTGNECTMVLTHAYKKVLRVQKELAQLQICNNNQAPAEPTGNGC